MSSIPDAQNNQPAEGELLCERFIYRFVWIQVLLAGALRPRGAFEDLVVSRREMAVIMIVDDLAH